MSNELVKPAVFESNNKALEAVRRFLASDAFTVLLFFLAVGVIALNVEIPGAIMFGFIICTVLILSDDIVSTFMPFFFLYAFVIRCKNSYDDFMEYKWAIPIMVFAVLFHIVAYRKVFDFKKGKLLLPMCLVSVTTFVGGLGIISVKEYVRFLSFAYMSTLGFVVVILYLAFLGVLGPGKNRTEHMDERLSKIMIAMTVYLFVAVIEYYLDHLDKFLADPDILPFQWRNNACTLLMIALPFCFYMATKKFPYIITAFLSYATMLMSGSRGGMVFGGIELLILIIYFAKVDKKHRKVLLGIVAVMAVLAAVFLWKYWYVFSYTIDRFTSYKENFRRLGLLQRSVEDFLANPINGRGLAYMGNRDIHPSSMATLCWYHSSIPQVIGSFGIVGIITYSYQMFCRLKFFAGEKALFSKTMFLSFVGLELMSLVNPGIFAPPFLIIITVFFAIVEQYKFSDEAVPVLDEQIAGS